MTVRRAWAGRWWAPVGLAATAAGGVLLLSRSGSLPAAMQGAAAADREWLLTAAGAAAASYPAAAVAQLGGLDRTALTRSLDDVRGWLARLVCVQLACACTNRLLPVGSGAIATNLRYLTRRGVPTGRAATAVTTTAAAGVAAHLLTLLVAAPFLLALPALRRPLIGAPPGRLVVLLLTAGAFAVGTVLARPPAALRRPIAAARLALQQLAAAMRDPSRAAHLLGGSLGVTVAHTVAFLATLRAVGSQEPMLRAAAVYVAAVAVAGLLPTPGGAGGVDVALLAGLTATGAPVATSTAAVLTFRLITFWLPVLPGAAMLLWLVHRRWL